MEDEKLNNLLKLVEDGFEYNNEEQKELHSMFNHYKKEYREIFGCLDCPDEGFKIIKDNNINHANRVAYFISYIENLKKLCSNEIEEKRKYWIEIKKNNTTK